MDIKVLKAYISAVKETADIVEIMGVKMLIIPEQALDNAIEKLENYTPKQEQS